MKTVQVNIYKFNELSDEAKQTAIDNLSDINTGYEWWENVYEDAKSIGLEISSFQVDRYIQGNLLHDMQDVIHLILSNHGEECDTHTLASNFKQQWAELVLKHSDGITLDRVSEDNESDFDNEADELEKGFALALREEYLYMLRKEYEYLTSKAAIQETIEANEYDFTEDGKLY